MISINIHAYQHPSICNYPSHHPLQHPPSTMNIIKVLSFLCLLHLPCNAVSTSQLHAHPKQYFSAFVSPRNAKLGPFQRKLVPAASFDTVSSSSLHSVSLLRGGATPVLSSLTPSKPTTLVVSTLVTAYMLLSGGAMLLKPLEYYKLCWKGKSCPIFTFIYQLDTVS